MTTRWRVVLPGAMLVLLLVIAGCTASQPPEGQMVAAGHGPGFWRGFWHGFIAPVSFIVSLFSGEVRIYAFPNGGRWYDFGFMLGIHGFSGGLFAGSRNRSRPRKDR